MEIYLVRHAVAEKRDAARWSDDSTRPLTAKGAKQFVRAARGLRELVPRVELVLSSPYRRAWQTAEILQQEAGWPASEPCDALAEAAPATAALKLLQERSQSGSVALIGHDPHLPALVALLLAGPDVDVQVKLEKGGIIFLDCLGNPAPGQARLRWILTSDILSAACHDRS
jgi:phosphohistidine phosphatase